MFLLLGALFLKSLNFAINCRFQINTFLVITNLKILFPIVQHNAGPGKTFSDVQWDTEQFSFLQLIL